MKYNNLVSAIFLIATVTLLLISGSVVLAVSGSGSGYILDYGEIKDASGFLSSPSYILYAHAQDIETPSASNTYQIQPSKLILYICGNGIKEGSEECDTLNFGSTSCASYHFNAGHLSCSESCTISTSGCYNLPVNTNGNGHTSGGGGSLPRTNVNTNSQEPINQNTNSIIPPLNQNTNGIITIIPGIENDNNDTFFNFIGNQNNTEEPIIIIFPPDGSTTNQNINCNGGLHPSAPQDGFLKGGLESDPTLCSDKYGKKGSIPSNTLTTNIIENNSLALLYVLPIFLVIILGFRLYFLFASKRRRSKK